MIIYGKASSGKTTYVLNYIKKNKSKYDIIIWFGRCYSDKEKIIKNSRAAKKMNIIMRCSTIIEDDLYKSIINFRKINYKYNGYYPKILFVFDYYTKNDYNKNLEKLLNLNPYSRKENGLFFIFICQYYDDEYKYLNETFKTLGKKHELPLYKKIPNKMRLLL